ncbi:MAG: Helix-turn-helix domain [Nocardioidaceae bacterium]|nr:Helix-turn-helix domain [Nocardioidaceae bacterium]
MHSHTKPVLIRPADVPERYGFTQRQIKRWCAEGKLRRVKPSGPTGPVYIRTDDLDALIEASTIPVGRKTKSD